MLCAAVEYIIGTQRSMHTSVNVVSGRFQPDEPSPSFFCTMINFTIKGGQCLLSIKFSLIKIGFSIIVAALSGQVISNLYVHLIYIREGRNSFYEPELLIQTERFRLRREKESKIESKFTSEFLYSSDFGSLFRGEVPRNTWEENLSKVKQVSLVISHCDKPLGWITNFTKGFTIDKIWVFSKCDKEVIDAPNGSIILKLPNIGRCDHTYAHWMNKYLPLHQNSSISEREDIVVFMKDNHHQRERGMWGNRTFGELLGLAATNGFGCMVPSNLMHKKLPPNTSVFFRYDILRSFYFVADAHIRESRDSMIGFKDARFKNIGEWIDKLSLSTIAVASNLVPVCIGGVFAVTNSQMKKQPRQSWGAIEKSLSRGDNIQEGHFAERLWAALLSKPLDKKSARSVWDLKPQYRCRKNGASLWPLCGTLSLEKGLKS